MLKHVRWPWSRQRDPVEGRSLYSVSDPALAGLFQIGTPNFSGVTVGESTALSVAAVWRAVSLISQTIAQLPMRTVREVEGVRTPVRSFLDDPGGPEGLTPFNWKETVLAHLLLQGNAFLLHVYNGAGALVALEPIHPLCVGIEVDRKAPGGKVFRATTDDGQSKVFTTEQMTHIMGLSVDGIRGMGVVEMARNSLGTTVAGDRAAARMLESGSTMVGFVSPEHDVEAHQAAQIRDEINRNATGWENAGGIPVFNRALKFTPVVMTATDAQFLQSRQFQVEEIARWFGIPPHALMQSEKSTSWGTGIEEQNRGLARTVLAPWTARIEQALSRLLPAPRFVEFDFARLERPTPKAEIDILIAQVNAGLLTPNEARQVLNRVDVPGGDALRMTPVRPSEASAQSGVAA